MLSYEKKNSFSCVKKKTLKIFSLYRFSEKKSCIMMKYKLQILKKNYLKIFVI